MKRQHPEQDSQCAVVAWFNLQYPNAILFAIPNSTFYSLLGPNGFKYAALLKKMGMTPGVPDLFLAVARSKYCGLFLEMKAPKGVLSPEQRAIMAVLASTGYATEMAYSFEEAKFKIQRYLNA